MHETNNHKKTNKMKVEGKKRIIYGSIIIATSWLISIYVFTKPEDYWGYDHNWLQPVIEVLFIPAILITGMSCILAIIAIIAIYKKFRSKSGAIFLS